MLTLTEELFLLSLRDKKDTVGLPYSAAMPYALAGAMLVELALAGKVQLDKEKKVLPVGAPQWFQSPRLDDLLGMIHASEKPKKISHWINIVVGKNKKLEKELLAELIARGILKEEQKRILWVIPYTEYSQQDASVKYLRKQRLRDIVLGGQIADQQSIALLSLLKAIELLDNIFTQDEIKAAGPRVKEIIKDEAVGQSVIEILDTITSAAVTAALAGTSML
jgi:golgi phosphoprotein 3